MKISSSPIETLNLLSMSPSWFWKKRVKSMLNMRRFCFLKGRASPSASRTGASRGGRKLVGGSKPSEYSFSSQTQAGGNHRSHARRSRRPGKWSQERWWQSQEGCYRGTSLLNFQKKIKRCNPKNRAKNMCGYTLFAELLGRDTWQLPRIFRLFWQPQKIPTKITPSEKSTCQIFLPKKYLGIKIFKPKNILWPSPSLE